MVARDYAGDASRVWTEARDARRPRAAPACAPGDRRDQGPDAGGAPRAALRRQAARLGSARARPPDARGRRLGGGARPVPGAEARRKGEPEGPPAAARRGGAAVLARLGFTPTSVRTRCSSVAAGSDVRPAWTADGWMTVDEGATSQWNRSGFESAARGPASGAPAAIRRIRSRCARTSSTSQPGSSARRRASSSSMAAPRNRRGRHRSTIPAFRRSPRSTRGTTRMTA